MTASSSSGKRAPGRTIIGPARAVALLLAATMTLAMASVSRALETDQFTPPPKPLADLAPQFQQHLTAILQEVVAQTNIRHLDESRAAAETTSAFWRDNHGRKAAECLTEDYIAEALYDAVGHGLPECTIESWVVRSHFPQSPAKFDPSMGESIYGANQFGHPLTMQELSPTVNVFGVYFGTDKVGHLFQQGYEYFAAYRKAELNGADAKTALKAAVDVGIPQEKGWFGLLMVGVYSNGDLAANYAGLKLYLNLTRPVAIGGRTLPPILIKRDDLWEINPAAGRDWLRPFITEHFNEALNPSRYSAQLLSTVRARFPDRAAAWAAFYHTTRDAETERAKRLTKWDGEDYGHSGFENVVTVGEMLPAAKPPPPTPAPAAPAAVVRR